MDSSICYKVSWLDQQKLSNYNTNMQGINEMYTFIIYGVVGVGLLGVEFFQCTIQQHLSFMVLQVLGCQELNFSNVQLLYYKQLWFYIHHLSWLLTFTTYLPHSLTYIYQRMINILTETQLLSSLTVPRKSPVVFVKLKC